MEQSREGSPTRPVSSLRSHFENLAGAKPKPPPPKPGPRSSPHHESQTRLESPIPRPLSRVSVDLPRPSPFQLFTPESQTPNIPLPRTPVSRPSPRGSPRQRPLSMGPISPSRSPPIVTVESPRSPPKTHELLRAAPTPSPSVSHTSEERSPVVSRSGSPKSNMRHFRIPSRSGTPKLDGRQTPNFPVSTTTTTTNGDPFKSGSSPEEHFLPKQPPTPGVPPPINRAGKPRISSKPVTPAPRKEIVSTLTTSNGLEVSEERISPFSTPPSSDESHHGDLPPPSLPLQSKPNACGSPVVDSYFTPPPVHHSVASKRAVLDHFQPPKPLARTQTHPVKSNSPLPRRDRESPEDRPGLPPRRTHPVEILPPPSREILPPPSRDTLPQARKSLDLPSRNSMYTTTAEARAMPPPPKRVGTLPVNPPASTRASLDMPRTTTRTSVEVRREAVSQSNGNGYGDDSDGAGPEEPAQAYSDYPDSSQANRRPPRFKHRPWDIATKYETRLFAVCGEYLCTTGYITRVWNIVTGESLMSLSHGENIKITALAFKPVRDIEEEGKRLWLGTNIGDILEIDVPTQSVVYTKTSAHERREVVKIYRHASDMWSLDEGGQLKVWSADETGIPSLGQAPLTFRVPRGHNFSMAVGNQLWFASGKEVRIFQPSSDPNVPFQATQKPLTQTQAGEVTSGAFISKQSDRVYFGHTDGKISVYSRKDFSCLGVLNVSLYKISALVGVGDYLWAGFNTGMIYVYDTASTPWVVKKDWHAHENTIAGIIADKTSIWKLDRLQVVSLGSDNMLRIWDGMLKEDWLEADLQEHDIEYCEFREVTALVMTWNAGASKPHHLRHDDHDANFFRDLLTRQEPPDVLVFGFQELVDLEDKKMTAKSFFKKKKTDTSEQEHMSHQYRAWRDHLSDCIEHYMPRDQPYTLLHTASLVGLFSCVFVKASERMKIRNINAAEVKRGMGGLHGNKGALVMRFALDDSSICLINCHLAAGQTQTIHRNNDIAAILEAVPFPPTNDEELRTDLFVGGGDGSMILDHEICILNGDLNYRIDTMGRETVIKAIREGNLAKLLEGDQLLRSRKKNPGFRLRAFNEAPITFAPTYKYDVGTDNYDTSEKRRAPAWCDRLLYRGIGRIRQESYERHEVRVSDHRPVTGRFRLRVKTIDPRRKGKVWEECERRFEGVKERVGQEAKMEYLVNVLGLSTKEAQKLLR